ncbi:hypothetical protein Goklo_009050 [Gossypium klotzschianum]|uniref:Small ribosomal subunit protein uS5 C-terminal domain-containing protein n=1 Tax=Gossypium klotzschianum TaxID=34286 RepID=A0A7J8V2L0_9ROSI|nr:hypothetical protein [Gossypium klotzschianum]
MPCKVTEKCGSVSIRMVPAPRGAGIVAARVPKKVLRFAGIEDVFTFSRGSTKTLSNFVKVYKFVSIMCYCYLALFMVSLRSIWKCSLHVLVPTLEL